jgi:phosphoribosylanthranilate isomerase
MFLKICANTNLADAALAAELGADAVGFVFAPSKRQVTPAHVAAITPQLPGDLLRIGVFATRNAHEIISAVHEAGLNAVQLHSALDPTLLDHLIAAFEGRVQIIQSIPFEINPADRSEADDRFITALQQAFRRPEILAVLLDTARSGVSGGLGAAFDWAHAAGLIATARAQAAGSNCRVILAGGLNAQNVAEAIATLHPWGVDVASGVEARPGHKDPARLREFIAAVRQASA